MQHTGLVVSCEGDTALVRFARSKACAHCGACMSFSEKEAQVKLKNTMNARPGDRVAVELKPKGLLKASFLAYIVPLCALLAGVALGSLLSDVAAVCFGLVGAGLALLLLKWLEPRFSRMTELKPVMTAICSDDESGEQDTP